MRALREAVAGLGRAPLLGGLSVTSIGFSLFILGLFGLAAHNVDRALATVEEQVEVVAYLSDGASARQVELAVKEVQSFPEVAEVTHVTKVEALRDASRELTEFSDVFADLEVNPLPASLEVALHPERRNEESVREVADRIRGYGFVEEVRFGREWVERVFALRRVAGVAAAVLGGAFALVAVLLVATSVRMAILARSEAIDIMQTVGATPGYIRRPFLLEGLITGLAGGLVAAGLTWVTWWAVNARLLELAWIPDLWVVSGIGAAALLGMAAAWRAVRRELKGLYAVEEGS